MIGKKENDNLVIEQVGDGWKPLVNKVLDVAKEYEDCIYLIKEKWGCLRVYHSITNPQINKIIYEIEQESTKTCYYCGKPAEIICKNSYYLPLCTSCQHN